MGCTARAVEVGLTAFWKPGRKAERRACEEIAWARQREPGGSSLRLPKRSPEGLQGVCSRRRAGFVLVARDLSPRRGDRASYRHRILSQARRDRRRGCKNDLHERTRVRTSRLSRSLSAPHIVSDPDRARLASLLTGDFASRSGRSYVSPTVLQVVCPCPCWLTHDGISGMVRFPLSLTMYARTGPSCFTSTSVS